MAQGAHETSYRQGSKLEVIKGAGHFSFEDKPGEFARVLGAFLDAHKL